jgi:3-oxoacyl-[acyl-carrier protein] reductase
MADYKDFVDRNVVVTGASSGIGRATVHAFIDEGASVMAVGRSQERLEETRDSCSDPDRVTTHTADVGIPEQARGIITEAIARFGRLHVLVNNAGIAYSDPVLDLPQDHWDEVLAVNLSGPFFSSQSAARHMAEHGGGAIVNVASTDALMAESPQTHYNVSKAGIVMLTKSFAHELGHMGVRVNAVAPGQTVTPMLEGGMDDAEFRAAYLPKIPMRRPATPNEPASAIVFLASDRASFITGQTLIVDGGQLTGTWYDPRDAPPVL